jgi:hypothetical protein
MNFQIFICEVHKHADRETRQWAAATGNTFALGELLAILRLDVGQRATNVRHVLSDECNATHSPQRQCVSSCAEINDLW